jgi:hypothetical protein
MIFPDSPAMMSHGDQIVSCVAEVSITTMSDTLMVIIHTSYSKGLFFLRCEIISLHCIVGSHHYCSSR